MAPTARSSAAAAAAGTGSGSDASDGEADATRFYSRRRSSSPSPLPSRSRSRSKTPPPNLRPSAAALSSTPTSAGADVAAASDAAAASGGRAPSPRRGDGKGPPGDHLYSDADADAGNGTSRRVPSPTRRGDRSPSFHSDSDADAAAAGGRVPSPRRNRERTPRLHSDSDNSVATANFTVTTSEDDGGGAGDASPSPRPRLSTPIKASSIKPIRTRPMDVTGHDAALSSELRSKRRHSPSERRTPEYQKRPSRVWSPEDELTILNALIEYRAKKGRLPGSSQDTSKLHLQIYGRLTANASTTQLSDKVRRLKHKYKLQVKRAKNRGVPDLPTEHDRSVYELSKKVWRLKSLEGRSLAHEDTGDAESNEEQGIKESDDDMDNGGEHRERTSKKPKISRFENGNGDATLTMGRASHGDGSGRDSAEKGKQMYPYLWAAVEELSKEHPSGPIFRKTFGLLEKSKARAIEEKLRKFRMSVIRLQLNRMDLTKLSVGMVLDALEGAY
ncbi:hypothetical protein GQ55_6G222600 [Panicum hallii var. hallii]|uniref:Glabrous enhancer-binding protein-like DBD domain-containing protein n=1 Tax=Panicum hallii var. hallii TaxID=1504633 RepID=A0A2T7D8J5_9POAL|nr:hypothetical protein GQ55_6G222600 [Panicum hallii var. hallii]